MKNKFLIQAVMVLVKGAKFSLTTDNLADLEWSDTRKQPSKSDIETKAKELENISETNKKSLAIESFIYANYPSKKQNQDEKWVSSYTTKLKAGGVADLETKVVTMITSFFTGKTLADVLKDVTAEQKPYFEKLVKVGVRTEWAEKCIIEGKTAIAENREPVYPEFPKFD